MSENEACEKAEDRAKISALEQHAPQEVQSEVEHVCEETIEVKKESPPEVVPPEVVVKKQPEPAVDHNNSNYNNNALESYSAYVGLGKGIYPSTQIVIHILLVTQFQRYMKNILNRE